jgi:hypothetical protein
MSAAQMASTDIIALGQSIYGDPWLEQMAADLEYSVSQLWRIVYKDALITRRMSRRLERLEKRRARKAANEWAQQKTPAGAGEFSEIYSTDCSP